MQAVAGCSGRGVASGSSAVDTRKQYAYLDCVYSDGQLSVFVVLGHFSLRATVS